MYGNVPLWGDYTVWVEGKKAFHPPGGRCPSAHTGADEGAVRAAVLYDKERKPAAHPHPSRPSAVPPSPWKGEGFGASLTVAEKARAEPLPYITNI